MNYDISLSEDGKHIRVRVSGLITSSLQDSFIKDTIIEARKRSVWRFFVDMRDVRNVTTAFEQYSLAYEDMNKLALDRSSKIAVCVDEDDKSHDFVVTVFQNAGFQCRSFTDESDALKWLADGDP